MGEQALVTSIKRIKPDQTLLFRFGHEQIGLTKLSSSLGDVVGSKQTKLKTNRYRMMIFQVPVDLTNCLAGH